MKRTLLLVGLVLALSAWAPMVRADGFTGALEAEEIYIQGDTHVSSNAFLVRVGADTGFPTLPVAALRADSIVVEHHYAHFVGAAWGGTGIYRTQDRLNSDVDPVVVNHVVATFEDWVFPGEIVAKAGVDAAPGEGRLEGFLNAPVPITTVQGDASWGLGPSREVEVGPAPSETFDFEVAEGELVFDDPAESEKVEFVGDFTLWLYSPVVELNHDLGTNRYVSGARTDASTPPTTSDWVNITVLKVINGEFTFLPQGASVSAYTSHAVLSGDGRVLLEGASGSLEDARGSYPVEGEVSLVGQYELALRTGNTGGFVTGVAGEFERSLIPFANAATPAGGLNPLWWVLAVGLVAAGGTSGLVLLGRRKEAPAVAPVAVTAPPPPVVEPVADAAHMEPGFTWADLSEEFGVVKAGERSGLIVVLVPANRVERFLQAVVARGLMAEDTGDRVHAAEHELAVVTLEPSPVMMN